MNRELPPKPKDLKDIQRAFDEIDKSTATLLEIASQLDKLLEPIRRIEPSAKSAKREDDGSPINGTCRVSSQIRSYSERVDDVVSVLVDIRNSVEGKCRRSASAHTNNSAKLPRSANRQVQ